MDSDRILLALCIVVLLVIVINGALLISFRRGGRVREIELLHKAAQRARNPWKEEQDNLEELSRQVNQLKIGSLQEKMTQEEENLSKD